MLQYFIHRKKILYCRNYHYEQRQRYVHYRSVEDEHSPPMAHHESPIACERYQRDTEFGIRNQDWYLRGNDNKRFYIGYIFFSMTIAKTTSLTVYSQHLRQNISSSRALTFPCFLIIDMSLPSALSRATPENKRTLRKKYFYDQDIAILFIYLCENTK